MADGLEWRDGAFRYEEKLDGRLAVRQIGGSIIVGELMRDGRFYAFDCLQCDGQDLAALPLGDRLSALDTFDVLRPATGNGGEFLRSVLARGGEGVVAKNLSDPWGCEWFKCKRSQVFYCRIAGIDDVGEIVRLADRDTGEARGRMALRGRINEVRVGSLLKVEAYGLTAKGLLREARPDKDAPGSWLSEF